MSTDFRGLVDGLPTHTGGEWVNVGLRGQLIHPEGKPGLMKDEAQLWRSWVMGKERPSGAERDCREVVYNSAVILGSGEP